MALYIITRHNAAIEFLCKQGFAGGHIVQHADDAMFARLAPGDIVVGTLPIHLAARACEVTRNPFGFLEVQTPPDKRGAELTLEEMERFGATVTWWNVGAAQPPKVG